MTRKRNSILTPLLLVALFTAHHALADSPCPPPSVNQGGQCVLKADAVLSDTMSIPSGTTLNCQGHRLTPVAAGILDDPRTVANEFAPSRPELALFIQHAYDVTIQNCVISGFDFGIIVLQSKTASAPPSHGPTANLILGNTISVRTNAIDVIKSDSVFISGNQLTYASERGRGVVLNFDSDNNEISGNTITSSATASTGMVRILPGGAFVTGTAVMDNGIHCLLANSALEYMVVSGILYQIPANDPTSTNFEDAGRTDHNLIALNDISHLGGGASCTLDPGTACTANTDCTGKGVCLLKADSGIGFNIRASDTTVTLNRITGHMSRGISYGGQTNPFTIAGWYPGKCTLDANRICSADSDCDIPGYDTASKGVCSGAATATFDGDTLRLTAAANTLSGVFDSAALFANNSENFSYIGNVVSGGASGIRINASAINGTIEHNIVSGATNALYLAAQPTFTQTIQLNDFTGYATAIRTSNDFTTVTDISGGKQGNYWGLPCPGFDKSKVLFDSGAINPNVFDGKPYGVPVALALFLPPSCK